jgi:hypothetical protein
MVVRVDLSGLGVVSFWIRLGAFVGLVMSRHAPLRAGQRVDFVEYLPHSSRRVRRRRPW